MALLLIGLAVFLGARVVYRETVVAGHRGVASGLMTGALVLIVLPLVFLLLVIF